MNVGVIGSGTMGSGIAQIAATNNCNVKLYDINSEALATSKNKLEKILNRLIEKGRIDENTKSTIQSNITYVNDLNELRNSDLVIEAIIENLDIKKKLFSELESIVSDSCILASNTSSLSITSIAAACTHADRFIGLHFFNPAPLMKLVEVIPAIQTSKDTLDQSLSIIDSWEKITVIAKDTPGFIVNKVARPFYGEATKILEEQDPTESNMRQIDLAMKSLGFRMGPFELMDFIGNDVNYTVSETVYKAFYYDGRYRPSLAQKRLSEAGYLGKKTNRGWYEYESGAIVPDSIPDLEYINKVGNRILTMLINEAADTLFRKIATKEHIDLAMTKGVNYPKGLFAWADEIGIQSCVDTMDGLYDLYREERYRCSPLLRKMATQNENFYQEKI
jgi:3-hydroxybutyryl-CoA dehydrogenase